MGQFKLLGKIPILGPYHGTDPPGADYTKDHVDVGVDVTVEAEVYHHHSARGET